MRDLFQEGNKCFLPEEGGTIRYEGRKGCLQVYEKYRRTREEFLK
jgi:hypothetical protein